MIDFKHRLEPTKISKDGVVRFYEDDHTYWNGKVQLQSVTGFIEQYKTPFDMDKISNAYAIKYGLDQQDVINEWKAKKIHAGLQGTSIHKIFEDYIDGKEPIIEERYPKSKVALKFIKDYIDTGRIIPVETEYIAYNQILAGQVDLIAKNKLGEHFIIDYKTNKEIKTSNKWQNMNAPYDKYDDCNLNYYSLQLEIYKHLVKEYNISRTFIVHIGEEKYTWYETKKILKQGTLIKI